MEQLDDPLLQERQQLTDKILKLIGNGGDQPFNEPLFDELALAAFTLQYRANQPYRQFCDAQQATPESITNWRSIPAFPTTAFKDGLVTSFPRQQAVMAQLTSGTTANRRGQIFRDECGRRLVFAANRELTANWLFPDHPDAPQCRVLILAPSPQMAPSMGMAIGMEETRRLFGSPASRFLLGHGGIDIRGLIDDLEEAEASGEPVALIGATGAFVYLLRACERRGISFRLPPGSRISDGGGYRGRFGDMARQEYYDLAERHLSIGSDHCINVLGMAESASNYFENTLRDRLLGIERGTRRMVPPPWCRIEVVSRDDLTPLPAGETGLLRHYDLANLPTVVAVQSDNLGVMNQDGSFRIIGRARLEGGLVAELPAERTVGPLGDNRIFRFLESYVNFSIRFKMGRITGRKPAPSTMGADCPCGATSEEIVERGGTPQ